MTRGLAVSVCEHCGRAVFPPRQMCPSCGGVRWERRTVQYGLVSRTTTVARAVGVAGGVGVHLAEVRADGLAVIARTPEELEEGAPVSLGVRQGRVLAERAPETLPQPAGGA